MQREKVSITLRGSVIYMLEGMRRAGLKMSKQIEEMLIQQAHYRIRREGIVVHGKHFRYYCDLFNVRAFQTGLDSDHQIDAAHHYQIDPARQQWMKVGWKGWHPLILKTGETDQSLGSELSFMHRAGWLLDPGCGHGMLFAEYQLQRENAGRTDLD